jgi:CheY-like chemotaxis protein
MFMGEFEPLRTRNNLETRRFPGQSRNAPIAITFAAHHTTRTNGGDAACLDAEPAPSLETRGQGCALVHLLPLPEALPSGKGAWSMARLIVVEDEPQVLVLAESILAEAGHEAKTAADVAQALALLRAEESFDVLFVDVNLGDGTDGMSLASEAVQMRKTLKVIYTSASILTDGMKELLVPGSIFLPKPYVPNVLLQSVDKLMRAGHGLN